MNATHIIRVHNIAFAALRVPTGSLFIHYTWRLGAIETFASEAESHDLSNE